MPTPRPSSADKGWATEAWSVDVGILYELSLRRSFFYAVLVVMEPTFLLALAHPRTSSAAEHDR